ncbi:hypothetical protein [Sporosarcina highlanderae]|uniref:Lipoprotein n=1 Tax=Sporosarcina highlanderae TaxID=3035916 RepID=A0ABT8JQF0_9BACL|nr:hypothetical protein [Sporosarcina highlanderae]MDN4607358.1 hypothetical protein [Sporosarcina highlanderae]
MKKLLMIILATGLLAACSEEATEPEKPEVETQQVETTTNEPEEKQIDTSVYEFASNVDVTDARDINSHITLEIDMKTDNQGLAFQHVLNQTYDFLQLPDIEGAETVTINVLVEGKKIAMFTTKPGELEINDDVPMAQLVLNASVVEMALPKVKEYAAAMELKMNKE